MSNFSSSCVRRLLVLLAICGIAALAGCSGQPERPGEDSQLIDQASSERVRDLLAQAQISDSPRREQLTLQAAGLLVKLGENDWAENLLASIDPDLLFADDFVSYTLLYSELAIAANEHFLAQRILTNPRIEQQWNSLSAESVRILRQRRAELFALLGESIASVVERITLSPLLDSEEEKLANQDAIWQNLMSISQPELQALSAGVTGAGAGVTGSDQRSDLKGWIDLAILSKNNASDLDRQLANIEDWMTDHPSHPASLLPPGDLQLLRQLVENQPRQVALLLPLNGDYERAGRAVRDGFLAAYFEARGRGSRVPHIRIFDTNEDEFAAVYDLAVQDGAELIIGPLRPENLDDLYARPSLPVPTLALNYAATPFATADQLYQFSFEVEDEARQVARRAWLEGHRFALVLVPQSRRGERYASAFRETWEGLGGTIVNQSYYADQQDYSGVVESALLVDDSKARARNLRRLLGGDIKFETPRRRQDVDFVFMVADAAAAQLLKPTLAYHYASDLPVYSTSTVFVADADNRTSRDLNGIRFITLPWYFDSGSAVKKVVSEHADPESAYVRLYAMGVDAFRIYPRLKQLEDVEGTRFYGQTGVLALTPDRKVQREQIWAQIVDGRAMPLPTVVTKADVP